MKKRGIYFKSVFTGQHRELYEDVKNLLPTPDYNLDIMKIDQSLSNILINTSSGFSDILISESPDLLIVQGDTTTVAV